MTAWIALGFTALGWLIGALIHLGYNKRKIEDMELAIKTQQASLDKVSETVARVDSTIQNLRVELDGHENLDDARFNNLHALMTEARDDIKIILTHLRNPPGRKS